ncbi:MAG: sulfatase [Kofleriaceae bacterium]|nr:sulfatase [Kofleriaceae bacterium]
MPSPSLDRSPTAASSALIGALAGALALAAAGVIDGLWSWGPARQFVPGALGRIGWLGYLATSHALVGAGVGAIAGLMHWAWMQHTRLGTLWRFARARHDEARAADPRDATIGLALVVAGVPTVGLALGLTYRLLGPALAGRKRPDLVIASSMAATVAALAAALLVTFVLARPVELGLRALAGRRAGRPLSAFAAPWWALALLIAGGAGALAVASWTTVQQLPRLRGPAVAVVAAALLVGTLPIAARAWRQLVTWPRRAQAGAAIGALVLALVALLGLGRAPAVIKASAAYTGLGGPVSRALRRAFDLDRDGYARFLGGGDCDDGDAGVHPGASEIPDDGVDQNCVGGDVSLQRSAADVAFAPVPPGVPADLRVLVITLDTVRADHVSAYGYRRPTTPALDRLAAEGALFRNGWAHAPSTRYSIPAILTGRLPLDVYYDTSIDGWPGLAPRATTLGEVGKAAGLATGAITNYWYFDESRRMNQGFDRYDNSNQRLHAGVPGQGPAHTRGSSSAQQTDKAIAFVDQHASARWMLWVHYYDPHYEYEPHADVPGFGTDKVALYDGELRFTDHHLGRLLDHLRATGQYERTAIIVTGDHGEGFGEHGIDLHGYHLYGAQTKVPLIVRVPGLAPRVITTPAGHVDLLPTVANLLGQPASPEMMGQSLLDLLAGGPERARAVFQQLSYEGNHELRGVADTRCHVIYNVSPDTSWESYQLDTDPDETTDLGERGCAETRATLARWYDASQIPAGAAEALLPGAPDVAGPLGVRFGDGLELLAVTAPARARRGEQVELTWTFAVRARPPLGYKVFVHGEDGKGGRFVGDHAPVRPLAWWRPGQYIRYTSTLTVPRTAAPGVYTVWAGWWKGNRRLPARGGGAPIVDDRVDVAHLEVTP